MTNLRASSSVSWLTRERVLVGLPIVISGLVVAGLGIFAIIPAMVRIDELQTEVVDLQGKQQNLPNLRQQLRKAERDQQTLLDQQSLLVDLIAGQDRIATFLALLEQEATATGVTIDRFEPQQPPPPSPSPQPERRSQRAKAKKVEPPKDPMMALGYRQTAVALGVRGDYQALQSFLQRMESLEVVVEASDLELNGVSSDAQQGPSETELSLRLSFFDRRPEASPSLEPSPVKPG